MKRLHVHVAVGDLAESIRFYSTLFATEPTVHHDDYAKWMLDDPRVNFAISARGRTTGISHLGIQVDSAEELGELAGRLAAADRQVVEQKAAQCCYAKGDKAWVADPQGVPWETFHTYADQAVFGDDVDAIEELTRPASSAGCCAGAETEA